MNHVLMLVRVGVTALAVAALHRPTPAGAPCQGLVIFPFCAADTLPPACPCVPTPLQGAPGHGCPNSFTSAGALLTASSCAPEVFFTATLGGNAATFALMVKGDALDQPIASGDGLRCVGGQLIRFGGHNAGTYGAPLGTWTYPNSVQTLSVLTVTQQDLGEPALYQLYYRNVQSFCNASTTNWSNGIAVVDWTP